LRGPRPNTTPPFGAGAERSECMSFAAYWVVSGNLVASTVTTPIYGRLSDIYGLRLVLLTSIRLFVAASVLCALSQTMLQLIGSRILQGAVAVGLRSVSQAAIADIIPPRERGRYRAPPGVRR